MIQTENKFLVIYNRVIALVGYILAFTLFYYWPLFIRYLTGTPPSDAMRFVVCWVFVPLGFIGIGYFHGMGGIKRNVLLLPVALFLGYLIQLVSPLPYQDAWVFALFLVFVSSALLSIRTKKGPSN